MAHTSRVHNFMTTGGRVPPQQCHNIHFLNDWQQP